MTTPRQEIEFKWGEDVIRSRPTLARITEIERKFGAAPMLARQCANLEMPTATVMLPILAVMLRGCDNAPAKDAAIMEKAWDLGAASFVGAMTDWLVSSYYVAEPQPEAPPAGN
jgi:hypothetical protein